MAIYFAFQAIGATIGNQTSSALADLCTAEQRFGQHAVQVHAIGGGGVDLIYFNKLKANKKYKISLVINSIYDTNELYSRTLLSGILFL